MRADHLTLLDSPPSAGLKAGGYTLHCRADYIRHLGRRGFSPNTIAKIEIHLRAFENWLERPATDATVVDIETFLDTRKGRGGARLNDRSRCEWISHFSCFYAWSVRVHGEPGFNPCEAIMRPKLRRLLPRPISEADLQLALDRSPDRLMSAWLTLGAFAGFRCCEMAWLTVESVMWHEGLLNVFGKGRKERIVEMHPIVRDALTAYGMPAGGPVFRWPDRGAGFTPRSVSYKINAYLADIGLNATAHQLRHRFGTKLYEQCRDIRVVQELLGHASPQTTQVYTAFARVDARAAVLALPTPNDDATEAA